MTPLSFSVRRKGGSQHLHYETAERAAFAAIRLAEGEPGTEFILTAHGEPPLMTDAEARGHARAAVLSPRERSEIARIAAVARAASLSPERRSEIARAASLARWRGETDKDPQ
jgi:hypothetical protein